MARPAAATSRRRSRTTCAGNRSVSRIGGGATTRTRGAGYSVHTARSCALTMSTSLRIPWATSSGERSNVVFKSLLPSMMTTRSSGRCEATAAARYALPSRPAPGNSGTVGSARSVVLPFRASSIDHVTATQRRLRNARPALGLQRSGWSESPAPPESIPRYWNRQRPGLASPARPSARAGNADPTRGPPSR